MGLVRWGAGLTLAVLIFTIPFLHFRASFERTKRLREVTPGVFYRSGQMTVEGYEDAVERLHLRTIINLRDEAPDPDVRQSFLDGHTEKESALCARLGVRRYFIPPDLIPRAQAASSRPIAVDRFLDVLDDPSAYPILVHCNAGLNRTGVIVAVYRMEHDGWTPLQAWEELRSNGFGEFTSTADNNYITQYVLNYRPGLRHHTAMMEQRP
ncbi:MAG TPA: tyrosine-protein phosphatase [Gemmataceae bacterium]|nr:tyrosine-protein phosphatase [Gemmataceae bacterium]